MSRIGRLPVALTGKVKAEMDGNVITVTGPLGVLSQEIANPDIKVEIAPDVIHVTRTSEEKAVKSAHGLYRSLIANMVDGVEKGYTKNLIIAGVGYKAIMQGSKLVLNVGYSHPVHIEAPEGIKLACVSNTEISVTGIDKTKVGQCAANIKAVRKPEPYHGYGVRYKDETILRKEGKTAGK